MSRTARDQLTGLLILIGLLALGACLVAAILAPADPEPGPRACYPTETGMVCE